MAQNPARTICLSFLLIIGVGTALLILPLASRDGTVTPPLEALFTTPGAIGPPPARDSSLSSSRWAVWAW